MVKFKIILTLFLIIICLVKFSSLSFADQNIVWTQTENPSTGWEAAYAVTSDADYIYIVGEDASSDGGQWRIQKRKKSDGSIIWTQMENPSSRVDRARAITSDADYIYIAGEDAIPVPNDWQWRIQKRNKSDGSIVWTQTENPSTGWDIAYAIISDDNYLYIAGYDSVPGNWQWRIQKRTLYTDIGLRIFDGTQVVAIACEPTVSSTYPLRIRKGTTTYGIVLVEPSDSKASKMRIRTNTGIKALRKL